MSKTIQNLLIASTAMSLALCAPAYAQGSAAPAAAEEADTGIADIIVTATRRDEKLQTVPISISAFGAAELAATGTSNAQDLAGVTPGLTMANQSAALTPFIRGVGATDNTVGQEAAVATYVDGVYIGSVYGSLFSFNNIERVEVLKGPQGTLFGRNATGGLIHVITKDPSQTTSVQAAVSYGSYNTVGAKLYATTGLGENLATDIAVIYKHQDKGWGNNVNLNREIGFGGNDFAARSKIVLTPGSDTTIKLSLDYSETKGLDIGSVKNILPGSVGVDSLGSTPGFYNDRAGYDEYVNTKQSGASLNINHDLGGLSVNSISSYRKTKVVQAFDNDATPVRQIDVLIDNQTYRTFTQELQLLSPASSSLKWILGAFYMHDKSGFDGPLGLGLYGTDVGGTGVLIKSDIKTTSYSVFGEATLPLGEATKLTGGIRYTHDKRTITGGIDVVGTNIPGDGTVVFVALPSATYPSFSEGKPTWRVTLSHQLTPEVLTYASYNRGFKSGNFNTTSPFDAPFKSESIDAYEVGFKAQAFDNRLRLNAAAFLYKYENLQLTRLRGASLFISNAAAADIKGIDFDGEIVATDWLRFRFGAALLDTKFGTFIGDYSIRNANGTTSKLTGATLTGNDLTRSPHTTFNIGTFANVPVGNGKIKASANYVYNSGYFWEPDNRLKQKAYGLLNAEIGWSDAEDRLGVRFYVKNLTKTQYSAWQVSTTNGDLYAPAAPRTMGAELSFKF
jgi:iron complex outermembrane recepter protein